MDNCLENLAMEKHIQSRIPRIWELIGMVNTKYTEPAVQKAAIDFKMTATEAKALIACPVQYSTLLQKCVLFFCGEAICCLDVTHVRYTFDFGLADKTGNLFRELNADLRMMCQEDNDEDRRNLIAVWGPYMKTMLTAMYKMEPLVPALFYRGRPEEFFEVRSIYNAGREVTWAGFTSVSRDIDQASYLAGWQNGCVLELSLHGAYDISKFSFFPREQEAILPPGKKMIVLATSRIEDRLAGDGLTYGVKVITMQEVKQQLTPLVS